MEVRKQLLPLLKIGGQESPMTPETTKIVYTCTPPKTTTGMTAHVLASRRSFAKSSRWILLFSASSS